jgi:O-methyltransferase involved in polyketide biosynthesis
MLLHTHEDDPMTSWLLFYLAPDVIEQILDAVTRLAAPGSRLGFDIPNGRALTSPWTKPWVDMQAAAGAPWIGTMDDPAAELAARGWRATVTQPGSPEANHGRWTLPVVPAEMTEMPHSWYVTAEREG